MTQRISLAGALLTVIGAAMVVVLGANNANGASGPAIVVLVAAVAAVVAVASERVPAAIVASLAAGILAIVLIEAIPVARYSGDLDVFGGLAAGLARLILLGGSVALLAGTVAGLQRPRLAPPDGRLLLLVGAAAGLLVAGWLALVALALGFAPRAVDGLAILSACLAVGFLSATESEVPPSYRQPLTAAAVAMAAAAALVTLSTLLSIGGKFGALIDSGALNVVAYFVYVSSVIPAIVAVILFVRPLLVRQAASAPSPPAAADQLSPPPPPPPPPPVAG